MTRIQNGMERRRFLTVSGAGAVGALGALGGTLEARGVSEGEAAAASLQNAAPLPGAAKSPENFRTLGAPVVQAPTDTEATIAWSVNDTSTGWVEFGETAQLGQRASAAEGGLLPLDAVVHKVRLRGLKPNTKYFYRTYSVPIAFLGPYDIRRGRPFASPTFSFTTLDAGAGDAVSFSVINDTHETRETLATLTKLLKTQPTDMTFWNGDMFDDIRSGRQVAEQLLYPADAAYAAERPVFFTRGNHDIRGAEARSLGRFIDTPGDRYYYSFRQGPVAFICLDTGEDKPDDHPVYAGLGSFAEYRTEQQRWLTTELQKPHIRFAPFRIVIAHIPLYRDPNAQAFTREPDPYGGHGPSGGEDARAKWHDQLVQAKVDLLIVGHTHRHAYLEPDATRPFPQLTGGGPQPAGATLIQAKASSRELSVTMQKLDGTVITQRTYPRRT